MKKISVKNFKEAAAYIKNRQNTVDYNGLEISIKDMLSLDDMVTFINSSVNSCFDDNDNYMPEIKDFVIKANTIGFYTNISLPSDTNEMYEIIYYSWDYLSTVILNNINCKQYEEMIYAIESKIEDRNNCSEKLSKTVCSVMSGLKNLIDNYSSMIKSINKEDIDMIVNAVKENGGKFDESVIVDKLLPIIKNNGEII